MTDLADEFELSPSIEVFFKGSISLCTVNVCSEGFSQVDFNVSAVSVSKEELAYIMQVMYKVEEFNKILQKCVDK